MTATLSSDVQLLNGVSSDAIAVFLEGAIALLFGVAFAFYWSWPMAFVCIGVIPIIMIAGVITTKANNANMLGVEELDTDDSKSSDITSVLSLQVINASYEVERQHNFGTIPSSAPDDS